MTTSTSLGALRSTALVGFSILLVIASTFLPALPTHTLVTIVHEVSHALAAIITGGSVDYIQVNPDTSGVAYTNGGSLWFIATAGYLGTLLVGLLSLVLIRHGYWRAVPMMLIGFCALAVLFAGVNSLYTTTWALTLGCVMLALLAFETLGFIGTCLCVFQLVLNAFYDLRVLFNISGTGVHSDAALMKMATGLPEVFWASLWIIISVIITLKTLVSLGLNSRS